MVKDIVRFVYYNINNDHIILFLVGWIRDVHRSSNLLDTARYMYKTTDNGRNVLTTTKNWPIFA